MAFDMRDMARDALRVCCHTMAFYGMPDVDDMFFRRRVLLAPILMITRDACAAARRHFELRYSPL